MARHIITAVILFSSIIGGRLEDVLIADKHSLEYQSLCSSRRIALNGSSLRDVVALAYDPARDAVIISEAISEAESHLLTIRLTDGAEPQPVPLKGTPLGLLEGLAVSEPLSAVFATDSTNQSVVRLPLLSGNASAEGAHVEVLHQLPGDLPRAIAVLDTEGLVFWTNWRYNRQSVERSRLDGSTRQQLISSDLYLPNGVAVDSTSSRLYFLETDTEGRTRIETTSLEGKQRRVVYLGHHPRARGLQLAGRYLYWLDSSGVWRLPVDGGKATRIVERPALPHAMLVLHGDEDCTTYTHEDVVVTSHPPTPSAACRDYCLRGTCVENEPEERWCVCPAGFSGLRCETSVCTNFCLSGGTCEVDSSGMARCRCPQGWAGPRCCRQERREQERSRADPAPADTPSSPLAGAQRRQETEGAVESSEGVPPPLTEPSAHADGIPCGMPLVFGLSASSLRLLLVSLLLVVAALVTMLSMLAIRLRRSRAACRSPAAYVAASAPRRIVADKRLLPRPDRSAPDIEDCCMMTLCETPCVQSKSRPSSRLSSGVDSTCERRALVQPEKDSCEKQALADLF